MDAEALKTKQKNLIVTNIELATEIQKIVPKVAYYCRLYGVEQALNLGQKDMNPAIKQFILEEFQTLENLKAEVGITKESRDADAKECLAFAKSIFVRAMKMDRPDLPQYVPAAALSFKKAVKFFQVATQFGELPEDCVKAKNYAATRCIDLAKAHKAGEAPPPAILLPSSFGDDETAALMAELNSLPDIPSGTTASPAAAAAVPAVSPAPMPPAPPPPPRTATLPPGAVPSTPPPRKFTIGQQVKYCPDGTVNCIKEDAIVQNATTAPDGQPAYRIYLTKRRQEITVPGELLAPALETGSKVVFYPDDGQGPEEVEVEEIYGSRWPPTYLIKRPGRGLVEAEDERLLLMTPAAAAVAGGSAPPAAAESLPEHHGDVGGLGASVSKEESKNVDPVAELAALQAVAAALAAAEAEAEEKGEDHHYEDLSTIGEGTEVGTEEHGDEEDGAKSTSSSIEAAKIVQHVMATEESAGSTSAAAVVAPPHVVAHPPPPVPMPPPTAPVYSAPITPTAPPPPPPAPIVIPAAPAPMRAPAPAPTLYPVPAAAAPVPAGPASYALPIDPNYHPPLEALMEAQKVTKSAGSAMAFEDVPTAVRMLQDALHLLTRPGAKTSSMKKK